MHKPVFNGAICIALAASLSACAGAGVTPPAGSGNAAASATTPGAARPRAGATMTIRIPHPQRHPAYVSPATRSLTILANGAKLGTFDLTPTSKGCADVNGATQCRIKLGVPTGEVTFEVQTFSGTDGQGDLLSDGTVTKNVVEGKRVLIALTLSGIVKSVAIALSHSSPPAGTPATERVYVTAYDAAGEAIVGGADYESPIALANSDASGATKLSATSVKGPADVVTLSYDGSSLVEATIGASVGSSSKATATFAPVPVLLGSYAVPESVGGKPYAIASGPDQNLWFTTTGSSANAIVRMTTDGAMTAFRGGRGGLTNDDYRGIAAGSDGNVWFTEYRTSKIGRIDPSGGAGAIREFALPRGWCPYQIVADRASDGLWFTSYCKDAIGFISTSGRVQTYTLPRGGSRYTGIVVGKDGNLYVADRGNGAIGQVRIARNRVEGYSEVRVGANPFDGRRNENLLGLAQTGDGTIWWTNEACAPSTLGRLAIASPFSASKVEQYITKVGCSNPAFLTAAPNDGQTVWLAEEKNPIVERVEAPAGGGVPKLTDFTIQAETPNGSAQHLWAIALGPDGNLWTTVYSAPGNVVKLVY